MNKQRDLKLKFYADTPEGEKNKLFVYKVKSFDHAIDLAAKFVQERNFKIRAAFFQLWEGFSKRFDKDYDLNTRENSLMKEFDIEGQLELTSKDISENNNNDLSEYLNINLP